MHRHAPSLSEPATQLLGVEFWFKPVSFLIYKKVLKSALLTSAESDVHEKNYFSNNEFSRSDLVYRIRVIIN